MSFIATHTVLFIIIAVLLILATVLLNLPEIVGFFKKFSKAGGKKEKVVSGNSIYTPDITFHTADWDSDFTLVDI